MITQVGCMEEAGEAERGRRKERERRFFSKGIAMAALLSLIFSLSQPRPPPPLRAPISKKTKTNSIRSPPSRSRRPLRPMQQHWRTSSSSNGSSNRNGGGGVGIAGTGLLPLPPLDSERDRCSGSSTPCAPRSASVSPLPKMKETKTKTAEEENQRGGGGGAAAATAELPPLLPLALPAPQDPPPPRQRAPPPPWAQRAPNCYSYPRRHPLPLPSKGRQ